MPRHRKVPRPWSILPLVALALAAARADADPLFASPPHFLSLQDRQQVVFFINESVTGALASRRDDAVEVVVPHAIVDATIRGTTFRDDESAAVGATSVALETGGRGTAAIRITTSAPLGGVHAYSEDDPPRLIVDLLAAGAQPTVKPTPVGRVSSPAPPRATGPAVAASPRATRSPGVRATTVPTARASAAPVIRATAAPHAAPTARPSPTARVAPPARPSPAGALGALHSTVAVAAADSGPPGAPDGETVRPDDRAFPCGWRRIGGVPFCAPDPEAPAYAMQADLRELASALASTEDGAGLPPAPAGDDDRARYLAADREFASRAAGGHLLAAVDAYRLALRRAPGFFDAGRARLNVALIYRTLGFAAEMRAVAINAGSEPVRPIIEGLAGDLAREQGALDRAREAYALASEGGGVGACLAARGRGALALLDGRTAEAASELERLPSLCPAVLRNDPETLQIAARLQTANGDPRGALQTLERVRRGLGPAREGGALEDVAVASVAAGDVAAARAAYGQLAHGDFGSRLAEHGIVGLARLDAAGGDTAAGFRRLESLSPDTGSVERRRFATNALHDALAHGADQTAVSIALEHGIAPSSLGVEDQIRLAHAMRVVGLTHEAQGLLRDVMRGGNGGGPDALWEERGACALAADEPAQALAIADDWARARGAAPPPGALALRARALAALGQAAPAGESLTRAVAGLDPVAARALRIDVAGRVRKDDPALAARLLREALADEHAPALSDADAAAALGMLAESAEASGDDAGALAAYSALTARYPTQASASGAAYRLARLTAGAQGGAAARAAYAEIAHSHDALERRMGAAAEAYESVVKPFENREAP